MDSMMFIYKLIQVNLERKWTYILWCAQSFGDMNWMKFFNVEILYVNHLQAEAQKYLECNQK